MKTKTLVLSVLGLFAFVNAQAAMPSSYGKARQILSIVLKVDETGKVSAPVAKVAPLVNSSSSFGPDVVSTTVRLPGVIGSIASPDFSVSTTESQYMVAATSHFKTKGPALAASMQTWMGSNGISFAWYSYEQKLFIKYAKASGVVSTFAGSTTTSGTPLAPGMEERLLVWTMSTDQSGRLIFGDPKIIAPRPKLLHVTYTPLKMAKEVPADWPPYAGAGTLVVETTDENFVPLPGTKETIDVHGAFDEPEEVTVAGVDDSIAPAYNANATLACLMDNAKAGCDASQTSVRKLLDERGATAAVVDYVYKLKPLYDVVAGSSPPAYAPRSTLVISDRTISYQGCADVSYYNKGTYGFTLSKTATRFLATADGQYAPLKETEELTISPTKGYEGTTTVKGSDAAKLANFVIDPAYPGSGVLLDVATLNVQSLAGISTRGSSSAVLIYRTSGYIPTGSNILSTHVLISCDISTSQVNFSAGWQDNGVNSALNWKPTLNRYTKGTVFTRGVPASLPISSTEDPGNHLPCKGTATYDGGNSITMAIEESCGWGLQLTHGVYQATSTPSGCDNFNIPCQTTYKYAENGLLSLFDRVCRAGTAYGSVTGQILMPGGESYLVSDGESPTYGTRAPYWAPVTAAGCLYTGVPAINVCPTAGDVYVKTSGTNTPVCVTAITQTTKISW